MDEDGIEIPDFREHWDEARRRSDLRKEAARATKAQAAGRSREEIKTIYAAELRERA